MKIHYFFRQFHAHQISVEKVFNTILNEVKSQGIEAEKIINPYPFSFLDLLKALFFFRKNQADINHVTGDIHWSVLGLKSEKTILTIHDLVGLHDLSGIRKTLYYYLWVYLPVKKVKYITVISEKTKNEIIALLPDSQHKISVIPNPLTTEIAPLIVEKNNTIPSILVVGTRSNKNIDRIIEAVTGLAVQITIIGELSMKQKTQLAEKNMRFINVNQISDQELDKYYDQADILCFPSLYEGFGLPILEAQARNCAVITSNFSPMSEVAADGALLIDPYSVQEIRMALKSLISDKELKKRLILAGRQNLKKYSVENVTEQYIKLYHKITAEK